MLCVYNQICHCAVPRLFSSVVSSSCHAIITWLITAAQSVLAAWIGIYSFGSWFGRLVLALQMGAACLVQPVAWTFFVTSACKQVSSLWLRGLLPLCAPQRDALPEEMLDTALSILAWCHGGTQASGVSFLCRKAGERWLGAAQYTRSRILLLFELRAAVFSLC